jgi:hypothetical protein
MPKCAEDDPDGAGLAPQADGRHQERRRRVGRQGEQGEHALAVMVVGHDSRVQVRTLSSNFARRSGIIAG